LATSDGVRARDLAGGAQQPLPNLGGDFYEPSPVLSGDLEKRDYGCGLAGEVGQRRGSAGSLRRGMAQFSHGHPWQRFRRYRKRKKGQ